MKRIMKAPLKTVLKNFLDYVDDLEARRQLGDDQYEVEFQRLKQLTEQLSKNAEYTCTFGQKEENRLKNRYKDILPYDFCRVILPECAGVPGSDYINASYIKGGSGAFAYIAAQGPLPNTVIDFWRMIWVCDVQVIVMACSEQEGGKTKCVTYWPPPGEIVQFGKISVRLVNQTQVSQDFLVRTLLVAQGDESREVWQFHYDTWPDHSVPTTVQPILHLVRLMRELQASETAPILVHCSAGCGRTGTICTVDFIWACLRTGKLDESFSLYDIVANMRRQRIAMVQTREQYMLVYRAVAEMFSQQLKIIDSHIYENLDKNGHPLTWCGQEREEALALQRPSLLMKSSFNYSDGANFRRNNNISSEDPWLKLDEVTGSLTQTKVNFGNSNDQATVGQLLHSIKTVSSVEMLNDQGSQKAPLASPCGTLMQGFDIGKQKIENLTDSLSASHTSAESIPFIDDDDTKSEIHVRARSGRAYLHIPSCDSISKIVNRFDPFADKVFVETDDSSPETEKASIGSGVDITPAAVPKPVGSECHAEVYSTTSSSLNKFDMESLHSDRAPVKSSFEASPAWSSISESDSRNSAFTSAEHSASIVAGRQVECEDDSNQNSRVSVPVSSTEGSTSNDVDLSGNAAGNKVSRRPSIARLKGLFEKSSRAKRDDKGTLFRHHSHHVSRAGSAPPSLNCMNKSSGSEKESLFGVVTRKFRSSSVKSEQELRKEASKTSALTNFKKSAAISFSHFRQNISNLSRNMPSIWPKSPTKQSSAMSDGGNSCRRDGTLPAGTTHSAGAEVVGRDKSMKPDKSTGIPAGQYSKSPTLHTLPSDNMQNVQQRFIVNLLSSGQSPVVAKKCSEIPHSSKPSSPRTRNFPVDFDCLKVRPFTNAQSKSGTKEQSTLWYHLQDEGNCNRSDEKPSKVAAKPSHDDHPSHKPERHALGISQLSTGEKVSSSVSTDVKSSISEHSKSSSVSTSSAIKTVRPSSELQKQVSMRSRIEMPQSKFYTDFGMVQDIQAGLPKTAMPLLPEGKSSTISTYKSSAALKPGSIGNSRFFWPSNSVVSSSTGGTDSTAVVAAPDEDKAKCDLSHVRAVECNGNQTKKEAVVLAGDDNLKDDARSQTAVIGVCSSVGTKSVSESTKVNSENTNPTVCPEVPSEDVLHPPALPKKTVIGRNRDKLEICNSALPKASEKLCDDSKATKPALHHQDEGAVNTKVDKQELSKNSKNLPKEMEGSSLYINVNSVTIKNIEQIENTLKAHPRGAIIDLTSRQSYSMEEELASAVSKLPEPMKANTAISQSGSTKPPGYEVIWPTSSSEESSVTSKLVATVKTEEAHSGNDQAVQQFRNSYANQREVKGKKSGICYSPPLRRKSLNFPVMKSHSCASLAWQQGEMHFVGDEEKQEMRADSAETLVSEAVVEFSTLLEELTTKTLSDDLNQYLSSSESSRKQSCEDSNVGEGNVVGVSRSENLMVASQQASSKTETETTKMDENCETFLFHPRHIISLKNSNDEEIVFHLPPPPSAPPPPERDSVSETFDILHRDGVFQVSGSSSEKMSAKHPSAGKSSSRCVSTTDLNGERQGDSGPVPLPRKAKHGAEASSKGLRKSASFTMLAQGLQSEATYENISIEKCQTLPRMLPADARESSPSLTQSSSTTDLLCARNSVAAQTGTADYSCTSGHKYEAIFPDSKGNMSITSRSSALVNDFKLSLCPEVKELQPMPVKSSGHATTDNLLEDYKSSILGPTMTSNGRAVSPVASFSKEGCQAKRHVHETTAQSAAVTSSGGSGVHKSKAAVPYVKPAQSESAYGKINLLPHKLPSSEKPPTASPSVRNVPVEDRTKKSVPPSRKAERAPLPPSSSTPSKHMGQSSKVPAPVWEAIDPRNMPKKLPSRKSGRAPEPPRLQKSASLKVPSSSRTSASSSSDDSAPTYAKVQKQKLHALLENISDTQCAFQAGEQKRAQREEHCQGKASKQTSNYSLQHSHSDASIFLALRAQKYQQKTSAEVRRHPERNASHSGNARTLTSSSGSSSSNSSSDSENTCRNMNISDEQKLQKHSSNEKGHTPVAPPRSKRRSTMEVHYLRDVKGALQNAADRSSSPVWNKCEEPVPDVPVKSRGAFEVPENFDMKAKPSGRVERAKVAPLPVSPGRFDKADRIKSEKNPVVYRKH